MFRYLVSTAPFDFAQGKPQTKRKVPSVLPTKGFTDIPKSYNPDSSGKLRYAHSEALYQLSYRGIFFTKPACISRWQLAQTRIHLSASAFNLTQDLVSPRVERPNSFVLPSR